MTSSGAPFRPDWASPPGDTIADLIDERGWSQAELARRLGYTDKHISLLINGKVALTEDAAIRLERVLGSTAAFWLTREAQYRGQLAQITAVQRVGAWVDWCQRMPVKDLMSLDAIPARRVTPANTSQIVQDLLRFFGVASPDDWERHYATVALNFRRTRVEQSDTGAICSWLRMGEIAAERSDAPAFERTRFEGCLADVRALTGLDPSEFA